MLGAYFFVHGFTLVAFRDQYPSDFRFSDFSNHSSVEIPSKGTYGASIFVMILLAVGSFFL